MPSNTSFATATTINLPYTGTQSDINTAGVNATVYYRFVAPSNAVCAFVLGVSGNVGSGYQPTGKVYNGPAGAPVQLLNVTYPIAGQNIPMQVPIVAGNEYFIEFTKNMDTAGPEHLTLTVEAQTDLRIEVGDIVLNDDSPGFPLVVLSHQTDYLARGFIANWPNGEAGDVLTTGDMIFEDRANHFIKFYTSTFGLKKSIAVTAFTAIRTSRKNKHFWVVVKDQATSNSVYCYDKDGTQVGITRTITGLAGPGVNAAAAKNDESVLYYAISGVGNPVKRWDLNLNVAMADLIAGLAGYLISDILVMSDDSLIVLYQQSAADPVAVIAKKYNSAGVFQASYSPSNNYVINLGSPRLAYALDDSYSFWLKSRPNLGTCDFLNIKVSDMSLIAKRTHMEYLQGNYPGVQAASYPGTFGASASCPFMIVSPVTAGLYYINPSKVGKFDTYYNGDLKLPDPTIRTALIGE